MAVRASSKPVDGRFRLRGSGIADRAERSSAAFPEAFCAPARRLCAGAPAHSRLKPLGSPWTGATRSPQVGQRAGAQARPGASQGLCARRAVESRTGPHGRTSWCAPASSRRAVESRPARPRGRAPAGARWRRAVEPSSRARARTGAPAGARRRVEHKAKRRALGRAVLWVRSDLLRAHG